MTFSETQIDKFCQSPLRLHLLQTTRQKPQLPYWERSPSLFLHQFLLCSSPPRRRVRQEKSGKKADWKELPVGSDRRISFLVLIVTPAVCRFKASLFLGLLGVWAVE